jgi:hypothetical protein
MTRKTSTVSEEIWEVVGEGQVWLTLVDGHGRPTYKSVGGPGGGKRIRLKPTDRENMEYAAGDSNPFATGRLRRVDGEHATEAQTAKTDEELLVLLESPDLTSALDAESEFNVRRLRAMAETGSASKRVTVQQLHDIKEVIDRRWPQPAPPASQLNID